MSSSTNPTYIGRPWKLEEKPNSAVKAVSLPNAAFINGRQRLGLSLIYVVSSVENFEVQTQ